MSRAKFLDKKVVVDKLTILAKNLKEKNSNVKNIVLFGSLAKNTYTSKSDADLLVILKRSDLPISDRIPEMLLAFSDAPVPVDVFPYTETEIEENHFAKKALNEGILLT